MLVGLCTHTRVVCIPYTYINIHVHDIPAHKNTKKIPHSTTHTDTHTHTHITHTHTQKTDLLHPIHHTLPHTHTHTHHTHTKQIFSILFIMHYHTHTHTSHTQKKTDLLHPIHHRMRGQNRSSGPHPRLQIVPVCSMELSRLVYSRTRSHWALTYRIPIQSQCSALPTGSTTTESNQQVPTVEIPCRPSPRMHAYAVKRDRTLLFHFFRVWNPRRAAFRGSFSRELLLNRPRDSERRDGV
jgi:hypothetical protein